MSSAQQQEEGKPRSVVLTEASFKRCLIDEKKAEKLDHCINEVEKSTAKYNQLREMMRISRDEALKLAEENTHLKIEIKNNNKSEFWIGLGVGAGVVGVISMVIAALLIKSN